MIYSMRLIIEKSGNKEGVVYDSMYFDEASMPSLNKHGSLLPFYMHPEEHRMTNAFFGKNYNIRNVTEFKAERIEVGGDILTQTLNNGVERVQLPRDAWANARAFDNAKAFTESGQKLKGVKTLWPESYSVEKIGDITTKIVESNPSIRNDLIEATVDGIKVNVRIDVAGKAITSYPAWKQ